MEGTVLGAICGEKVPWDQDPEGLVVQEEKDPTGRRRVNGTDIQSMADKLEWGTQIAPKEECPLNLHFSDCEERRGQMGKHRCAPERGWRAAPQQESEKKHSFLAQLYSLISLTEPKPWDAPIKNLDIIAFTRHL